MVKEKYAAQHQKIVNYSVFQKQIFTHAFQVFYKTLQPFPNSSLLQMREQC